jgi:Ser/Thr protein kinase RdoA (MazF antagonist)
VGFGEGVLNDADQDLAQRDQVVPGLSMVLDPEAFLVRARAIMPELAIESVRPTYVRYKPKTSCLVAYQSETADGPLDVWAKALPRDRFRRTSAKNQSRVRRKALDDVATMLGVFPDDLKLDSLPSLQHDGADRRGLFSEILPERSDLWGKDVCGLRYKPARRFVACLGSPMPEALLKLYDEHDYASAHRNAVAFASREVLRVARCLGRSSRYRAVAVEWMPGQPLLETLSAPDFDVRELTRVGTALAELHQQDPPGLERWSPTQEAERIAELAQWLGFVQPNLAERMQRLARRLADMLLGEAPRQDAIHGDFYPAQVVLTHDGIALIDFDGAVRGDRAADLGNFLAHLEGDALLGRVSRQVVEPARKAFLEGYRLAAGSDLPPRVRLFTAMSLLRLAPHCFRSRMLNWPDATEAIVNRAERITDGSGALDAAWGTDTPIFRHAKDRIMNLSTTDISGIADDPGMPFLALALDPLEVQRAFEPHFVSPAASRRLAVESLCVRRYKPGRRCLIEYVLELDGVGGHEQRTVLGKARARGSDTRTHRLHETLWRRDFDGRSADGISVPEPLGVVGEFSMWLQQEVPGTAASQLIDRADELDLLPRIAAAIFKLHQAGVETDRVHTIADELRILRQRLLEVVREQPSWAERLTQVYDACERLAAGIPAPQPQGIHRDFYPDQVMIDGERVYLVDLDLYCHGDPGLDIGNFIGHLTEYALRCLGDPEALRTQEEELEERYVALAGEATRPAIRAYALLTLVRHIQLSTQFPERRAYTATLLELCEHRLGTAATSGVRRAASGARDRTATTCSDTKRSGAVVSRTAADSSPNPYLFIVGNPRSGTTLLRRMVDAHPQLTITRESHWIPHFYKDRTGLTPDDMVTPATVSELLRHPWSQKMGITRDDLDTILPHGKESHFAKFVSDVFDLCGRRRNKRLVGDKTPGYVREIQLLHTLWPRAKFVHLIRDGREVCLSLVNWDRAPRNVGRFETWGDDPLLTAALWWKSNVRRGLESGAAVGPDLYHEVRYEELVSRPGEACAALCAFLGVPYDDAMLSFHEGRTKTTPGLSAKKAWLPPTPGLRDWRSEMVPEDLERFEAAAGDLLDELGYPRAYPQPREETRHRAAKILDRFTQHARTRGFQLPQRW